MNKIKKNNIVSFPTKLTDVEREIEAIVFAAAEPLSVETIESKLSKQTDIQQSLEKLRDKNLRTAKSGNKSAQKILETTNKYIVHLSAGNSARTLEASEEDLDIVSELDLLTMKPVLYVCNVDEASVKNGNKYVDDVKRVIRDEEIIVIATAIEAEISELENLEEQMMFLEELGLKKPGVHYLIQATYKLFVVT